jgi:iron complex outermembrane receptor protein
VAYEVGVRQEIGKPFSIDATAFTNIYRNLIGLETTSVTTHPGAFPAEIVDSSYTNDQSARTYGTEVAMNLQATDNWRLEASYSLLIANVTDYAPLGVTPDASAIDQSFPRDMAQIHSYLDITKNIELNASVYYDENIGNRNVLAAVGPAPGSYFRGDLGINWRVNPKLELSAGVQNAFEPHHLESSFNAFSSAEVDRAVYMQATWSY